MTFATPSTRGTEVPTDCATISVFYYGRPIDRRINLTARAE